MNTRTLTADRPGSEAESLYRTIATHLSDAEYQTALDLAEARREAITGRAPNPYDAEACRLIMLAAASVGARTDIWRARAMARYSLIGWHEGIAAVLMSQAFATLAEDNSDYADGQTLDVICGSAPAIEILDEMKPFLTLAPSGITVGPRSPSLDLLARFFHEKRGFLLLLLSRLDDARASYDRAAQAARGSSRGEIKVRAGRALVDYLDGAADTALMATERVVADARSLGAHDVLALAEHNVAVMTRQRRDLLPYEVL